MVPAEFSFEALEAPPELADDRAGQPGPDAVLSALAQAQEEAAELRAAAREEGLREGREQARAELESALAALAAAAEGVQAERVVLADALEASAVALALGLAEKVLAGALAVEPERVVEAVRGALRGLVERERVTVLVHPDDLECVREAMDDLRASLGGIGHCDVQAERRVGRGGALIRTPDGDVDARVETKLERAREVVEAAMLA